MTDNGHIKKIKTEDDRCGERHVTTSLDDKGNKTVVTKLYIEPKSDLKLEEVVTEHYRAEVYERTIDVVDESGNVVDRRVESVDPMDSRMKMVEHINSKPIVEEAKSSDCNCVTREELMHAINANNANNDTRVRPQAKIAQHCATQDNSTGGGKWFTWTLAVLIVVEAAIFVWMCI